MPLTNGTYFKPSVFTLTGIPGLESVQHWIGIPFFISFVLAIIGNGLLIIIVRTERALHEPMFIFLAVLATTDLGLTLCITPKMLAIFWLQSREIYFDSCLTQMYFTHTFQCMESGMLLAMAFDRYVAICEPLRHSAILTKKALVSIVMVVTLRASVVITMCPLLVKLRLEHFRTTVITHSYCEHMAVVKLAADNVRANKVYGLFVAFSVLGFDVIFIFLSYAFIFQAVFKLPQKEARFKAFNTCTAHIFVFLQFYILTFFTSFIHRFGFNVAPYVHILLSNLYLLLPPLLNPIVYGVKTKQIREGVLKIWFFEDSRRWVSGVQAIAGCSNAGGVVPPSLVTLRTLRSSGVMAQRLQTQPSSGVVMINGSPSALQRVVVRNGFGDKLRC
ncbi:olfactory receptor 52A5-like [Oryctolagus cuniculus]|uniref:olfactory receptor 52A5-like n=1 Tax=Oryctolagus cuniculus TaxID=9986 RepID=UPI00387A054B